MAVYFNGEYLDDDNALVHVSDLSMQRGYAVFDFLRTVNGRPLFIDDHLQRLERSATGMRLDLSQPQHELKQVVHELIKRSGLLEAGIRLMLTGGYSPDGYRPAEPNLLISCNPVKVATASEFETGLNIITHEHQRELPHIKSTNYLMAVWLQEIVKQRNAQDVLYYHQGVVSEFPRANFFMVSRENTLVTPSKNILEGVTRKKVIELAGEVIEVEQRDISVDELAGAKEAFLTSTTRKLMPLVKINDQVVGDGVPGPITRTLYEKFCKLEKMVSE